MGMLTKITCTTPRVAIAGKKPARVMPYPQATHKKLDKRSQQYERKETKLTVAEEVSQLPTAKFRKVCLPWK
jgi:hypothetical protein